MTGAPTEAWLVLAGTALYLIYHYGLADDHWRPLLRPLGWSPVRAQQAAVLLRRCAGGLLLGGGVVAAARAAGRPLAAVGLGPGDLPTAAGLAALTLLCLLPVLARSARSPAMRARYPEIRTPGFPRRVAARSAAAWAVYLLGYELVFRGLLLFPLAEAWGPPAAVAVSTSLYALAHLHKDPGETLACLPMGVVFGALALYTGAVWGPWALHLGIAVASEAFVAAVAATAATGTRQGRTA